MSGPSAGKTQMSRSDFTRWSLDQLGLENLVSWWHLTHLSGTWAGTANGQVQLGLLTRTPIQGLFMWLEMFTAWWLGSEREGPKKGLVEGDCSKRNRWKFYGLFSWPQKSYHAIVLVTSEVWGQPRFKGMRFRLPFMMGQWVERLNSKSMRDRRDCCSRLWKIQSVSSHLLSLFIMSFPSGLPAYLVSCSSKIEKQIGTLLKIKCKIKICNNLGEAKGFSYEWGDWVLIRWPDGS